MEELKREVDRLKLDVEISEVVQEEEGCSWSGDYRVTNTKVNLG